MPDRVFQPRVQSGLILKILDYVLYAFKDALHLIAKLLVFLSLIHISIFLENIVEDIVEKDISLAITTMVHHALIHYSNFIKFTRCV